MVNFAERDRADIEFLAKRDGRDRNWICETAVSMLRTCGYIPYLKYLPQYYSSLKDVSAEPVKLRAVTSSAA